MVWLKGFKQNFPGYFPFSYDHNLNRINRDRSKIRIWKKFWKSKLSAAANPWAVNGNISNSNGNWK